MNVGEGKWLTDNTPIYTSSTDNVDQSVSTRPADNFHRNEWVLELTPTCTYNSSIISIVTSVA